MDIVHFEILIRRNVVAPDSDIAGLFPFYRQADRQAVYIVVRHRVKPAVAEQVAALSSLARTGIDKLGGDLLLLLLLWSSLLWATQINMCFAIL